MLMVPVGGFEVKRKHVPRGGIGENGGGPFGRMAFPGRAFELRFEFHEIF